MTLQLGSRYCRSVFRAKSRNCVGIPKACFAMASQGQESVIQIKARRLTPEAFAPFGQVISAIPDDRVFCEDDAQLTFGGTPRFYIMRLPTRGLRFKDITYHAKVTQCLGCMNDHPFYIAFANNKVEPYPQTEDITVFRIPHGVFVKMECGTWHAGPLFDNAEHLDFMNLECSDTNVTDRNIHYYDKENSTVYEIVDELGDD